MPRGQYHWGVHLVFHKARGKRITHPEKIEGIQWITKSARQGYAEAQYDLAGIYFKGINVVKDLNQSFFWYQQTAKHNTNAGVDSHILIGRFYENGWGGVEVNKTEAARWYIKAEEKGSKVAYRELKRLYVNASPLELIDMPNHKIITPKSASQKEDNALSSLAAMFLAMSLKERENRRAWLREMIGDGEWKAKYLCRNELWNNATTSKILTICYEESGAYHEARGLAPCAGVVGWCEGKVGEGWVR